MSSFLRTALAVVVAAGLFGYIYLVESKKELKPEEAETTARKEPVFTGFDKLKATSLTLKKRSGEVIEAEKVGDSWTLISPLEAPADAAQIDSLLDSLQNLKTDDVVAENTSDLTPFGLAEPRVTVSVAVTGAAEPFAFELGDTVPAGSVLFARVPGDTRLLTVSSLLENTLDKSAFDLRDRSVIKAKKDDVQSFELVERGRTTFKFMRGGPGEEEWRGEIPVGTRAARWTVEGFLGAVENLRMESVVTEQATASDLARSGLDASARQLVLRFGPDDSRIVTLEIGKKTEDGKYYARDRASRLIVTINSGVVDDLDKGFKNFRASRLLEVASYEITAFDVTAEGSAKTFTKLTTKGENGADNIVWKAVAPVKDETQDNTSNAFFSVGAIDALEFIDAPRSLDTYGLDAPALRVALRFDGEKKEDWFEVAVKGENGFGRRRGDAAVLRLDKAKTEELIKNFTGLGS